MKLKKLLRDGDDFSRSGLLITVVLAMLLIGLASVNQLAAIAAGVTLLAVLVVAFSDVFSEVLQFSLYSLRRRRK